METEKRELRNNPLFVISIALFTALLMSAISVLMYYNSETRMIVEQIQQNNSEIGESTTLPEALSGELNQAYVDSLEAKIRSDIAGLDPNVDYNPDELTDAALGF